jgi:PAS domain S-box-containing protein
MIAEKNEILVLENDKEDIAVIEDLVATGGGSDYYDIRGSTLLSESLQLLANNHFDAILLDLGFNDIDGLDALRTIRRKAPKVPIIVIAGLQEEYLGVSALGDGAQDYLVKGKMDGSVIIRAINHAIEHKLVEESLVLKDRAIESSIDCIGFADMCGNIVYANSSMLQSLGYDSASELSAKNLFDIIASKEKSAIILKSLLEKGSWAGEDKAFRRDGSTIDIQISASMVKNDSGEPLCIMASWIDITERIDAEKELRIRDIAISSSLNAIAIADLDGNLISVNDAFMSLVGAKSGDDVIGRPLGSFYPNNEEVGRWLRIVRFKERWNGEFRVKGLEADSEKWVKALINLVKDGDKKPLCIIGSFIEITEQKIAERRLVSSEKKYRQLFEQASEGVWMIDTNDTTSLINPKMAEMLGYSIVGIVGKPIFTFVDGENAAVIKGYFDSVKAGARENREISFVRRDGSSIHTSVSASFINDENGAYAGILAFVTDISERKIYESQLKESKEESDKAKSRAQTYFDFMAHDIANIVSPILIYSQMICEAKNIPPEMRELCVDIEAQARRASSLISNLRRLEEVESMSPEEIENVDLRQVLSSIESSICREYKDKTFAISHSFPQEGEIMVKGAGIIEDVVQKIFDNAARYAEKSAIDIDVRVAEAQGSLGKRYWQLEIADSGPGMTDQCKDILVATPDESHRMIRGIYSSIPFCISLLKCIGGEFRICDRIPNEPEKGTKIVVKLPGGE